MSDAPIMETSQRNKRRKKSNWWGLVFFLVAYASYRFSDDASYWIKCLEAWRILPIEEAAVADLGPEALQRIFVKLFHFSAGIMVAGVAATLFEPNLRTAEGRVGLFSSRWNLCFVVFFAGWCLL